MGASVAAVIVGGLPIRAMEAGRSGGVGEATGEFATSGGLRFSRNVTVSDKASSSKIPSHGVFFMDAISRGNGVGGQDHDPASDEAARAAAVRFSTPSFW